MIRNAAVVVCILIVSFAAAVAEPVAVAVRNLSEAVRPAGPATFAMVFARGRIEATPVLGGLRTQADVKRRWPGGSVKHAVFTVDLPEIAAGATLPLPVTQVEIAKRRPPSNPTADLKDLADLLVTFKIHNGPTVTASLRKAIAAGPPLRVWLAGHIMREYHYKTAPTDEKGVADPDLEVRFRVRCYPAAKTARVAVVVENTKWTAPGAVPYDVSITADGEALFARENVGAWPKTDSRGKYAEYRGHVPFTRWVKRFWLGRTLDEGLHVRFDPKHLVATGLIPPYDVTAKVSEKSLARTAKYWAGSHNTQILQRGTITPYFPMTGGRGDIGPLPVWTTEYILSQDPRVRAATWGNGDLSGSCPVHRRDPASDWHVSLDEHPGFSLNTRGTRERIKPRATEQTPWILQKKSFFAVDGAHQPSLAFVPYMLGGDYYHLEEMAFWANHNMISIHYQYREKAKGLLKANQTRGEAWTLRNLLHVAAMAPDGSKEKAYFEDKLAVNLDYYDKIATAEDASPLGLYGATHAYTRGWPRKPVSWNSRYYSMPPWQHNFLAWAFAHCVDHGYTKATAFRDHLLRFSIGSVSHPDQLTPHAGSEYYVFIGERTAEGPKWCRTWKEISDLTYTAPRPPGVAMRKPPTKTRGNYAGILRGALIGAVRAGRPGALEAYRWVDSQYEHKDLMWAFEPPVGGE